MWSSQLLQNRRSQPFVSVSVSSCSIIMIRNQMIILLLIVATKGSNIHIHIIRTILICSSIITTSIGMIIHTMISSIIIIMIIITSLHPHRNPNITGPLIASSLQLRTAQQTSIGNPHAGPRRINKRPMEGIPWYRGPDDPRAADLNAPVEMSILHFGRLGENVGEGIG